MATESVSSNCPVLVILVPLSSPISISLATDSNSGYSVAVGLLQTYDTQGSLALIPCIYYSPDVRGALISSSSIICQGGWLSFVDHHIEINLPDGKKLLASFKNDH
ncbi:hypothetical protein PPACK8108_LOCUS4532 [Phakopsora pachyrhizi]|uniref:Uncharacterized protein n=1 Tax=Phakopsora pachyrhizi TaxID=170000 RepID=A0AAV0AM54_PHAPC|nr:hypothetical protein PPACK8108_LOCUS4532 [Phakopsora pachyrhizi]